MPETLPRPPRCAWLLLGALLALPACRHDPPPASAAAPRETAAGRPADALQFRIAEGQVENAFHQEGPVAAHLLLTSGPRPRVLVAFPAGNSGVGVWFEEAAVPVRWTLGAVRGARAEVEGRAWHGIEASATLEGGALTVKDAVLGSVRVLRDYQLGLPYPPGTAAAPEVARRTVSWRRMRLDGAPGYSVALAAENGRFVRAGGRLRLQPDRPGEALRLRIVALTGEPPLTPIPAGELLNGRAAPDERSRNALRFLSYREKFLAGSWRFDTYFGRDTLMSLRLLMPALQPQAVEAGLASVLARLSPRGEVAHEEDIGEFAVLRHLEESGRPGSAPIYDYKMVDDDYMLAPVAAAWLLEDPRGRARAAAFLAARDGGEARGAALLRNLRFVAEASAAFARAPTHAHLIGLKPGVPVGQWRDSNEGLGRGRYPWDVNAVWVPAALRAIGAFVDSGLLAPYADAEELRRLREAAARADAWERRAKALFAVRMDNAEARRRVREYAAHAGVDPAAALAALGDADLQFAAIALDARGRPVPVLHSDVGFELLFGRPDAATLQRDLEAVVRPFPAGLLTDVGLLVANPAYAARDAWPRLGRDAYHGTVVWAWQQALLAAGLQRQLQRDDLPAPTRARLAGAQARLWRAIDAADAVRTSELWSWSYADGRYRIEPFGAQGSHEDESNAAQLWSTVRLAIPRPAPAAGGRNGTERRPAAEARAPQRRATADATR